MKAHAALWLAFGLVPACFAQQPLTLGQAVSAELTPQDTHSAEGKAEDVYTLQVSPEQSVEITVSSSSPEFDTFMIVQKPDGGTVENDDAADTLSPRIVLPGTPNGGTATVHVTTYEAGHHGPYSVLANPVRLQPITLGQSFNGNMAPDVTSAFEVEVAPGAPVIVEATAAEFDAMIELTTPDGHLMSDDDSGGNMNPRVIFTPAQAGRALVNVSAFGGTGQGAFTLTARQMQPTQWITAHGATPEPTRVSIPERQPVLVGLRAPAGMRYNIEARSTEVDPMLTVTAADGSSQMDDDSAGGTDARVVMEMPQNGEAYLVVSSIDPAQSGDVTISVSEARDSDRMGEAR